MCSIENHFSRSLEWAETFKRIKPFKMRIFMMIGSCHNDKHMNFSWNFLPCKWENGASRWLSGKKNSPANAGDSGLIPGLGRSPEEGNGTPLQYSCLENPWTEEPGRLQSMGLQKSLLPNFAKVS